MNFTNENLYFIGFIGFIISMLAIDLGLFQKDAIVSFRRAFIMSLVWVSLALVFFVLLRFFGSYLHGIRSEAQLKHIVSLYHEPVHISKGLLQPSITSYNHLISIEFITGYLIEYALSIDNIFVIVLILTSFSVDIRYYHKVLLWGIIGAILMRGIFIFLGASLITRFDWILYFFGAFLIYTGISMFLKRNKKEKIDPAKHPVMKFASKYFSVSKDFHGSKFIVTLDGKKMITPLFIALLVVEGSDAIFALDSIPAIFSVAKDPYIVFFSNIFAILGLRSLFFLLINVIERFRYLKVGLAFLLVFIGIKMLGAHFLHSLGFTNMHSLIIILVILTISILSSVFSTSKVKNLTV